MLESTSPGLDLLIFVHLMFAPRSHNKVLSTNCSQISSRQLTIGFFFSFYNRATATGSRGLCHLPGQRDSRVHVLLEKYIIIYHVYPQAYMENKYVCIFHQTPILLTILSLLRFEPTSKLWLSLLSWGLFPHPRCKLLTLPNSSSQIHIAKEVMCPNVPQRRN